MYETWEPSNKMLFRKSGSFGTSTYLLKGHDIQAIGTVNKA